MNEIYGSKPITLLRPGALVVIKNFVIGWFDYN
ncbi:hypothetical protein GGU45_001065 [Niabella hirudinis]